MNLASRLLATVALLLASPSAIASDGFGIATFVIGLPMLVIVCLALGIMRTLAPSRPVKLVSSAVFVPTLLLSLYLVSDALSIFRNGVLKPDSLIGVAFFGLLALMCFLFYSLISR